MVFKLLVATTSTKMRLIVDLIAESGCLGISTNQNNIKYNQNVLTAHKMSVNLTEDIDETSNILYEVQDYIVLYRKSDRPGYSLMIVLHHTIDDKNLFLEDFITSEFSTLMYRETKVLLDELLVRNASFESCVQMVLPTDSNVNFIKEKF